MGDTNVEKLIRYWIDSSDEDFDTMMAMYNSKRFNWSLYLGHLMIEKLLKAYYVKVNNQSPPFIHNLLRLAGESNLTVNEEMKTDFASITAFNINTRYDDIKKAFKRCVHQSSLHYGLIN